MSSQSTRPAGPSPLGSPLVVGILVGAVALGMVLGGAAELDSLIFHGRPLALGGANWMVAGYRGAASPLHPAAGWPATAAGTMPGPLLYWFTVLLEVAVGGAVAWALWRWTRPASPEDRRRRDRAGMATAGEIRHSLGQKHARRGALQTRPGAARGAAITELATDLGRDVRTGQRLYGSLEDTRLLIGSQGTGKTSAGIIPDLITHPGPAVVTSTRADIWECTAALRRRRGPVYVLDPTALLPEPVGGRVGWALEQGCEDPDVAIDRGRDMVVASAVGAGIENANHWTESAAEVLRYYLHAAALGGFSAAEIMQWAARPEDPTPLLTLEHPAAARGWKGRYAGLVALDPRERSGVWSNVRRALDFLASPRVLATCAPAPGSLVLDPARLIDENATLYIVGGDRQQARMRPLIVAIVAAVIEANRARAKRTPGRRPDPPLALFLDECPQICPLPNLPQITATARGDGLTLSISCQSVGQLVDVWGSGGSTTIKDTATATLVMAGMSDARWAEEISKLCGEREEEVTSWSESSGGHRGSSRTTRMVPVVSPADIRALARFHALLIYTGMKPVETELTPWWKGPYAAEIRAALATMTANPSAAAV